MSHVIVGQCYRHPEDGPILVTKGAFEIGGRVSNHFYWRVLETGEEHHGYGGHVPGRDETPKSDDWVIIPNPRPAEATALIRKLYEAMVTTEGTGAHITGPLFDRIVKFLRYEEAA